jgi:acyl-CoA reductase-like NAD-dependent aldehyde dehydrogenase
MAASTTSTAIRQYRNLIGGEWVAPQSGATYQRQSPLTREPLVEIPWSDRADADAAIDAAREAFERGDWARSHARTRHDILHQTAARLREDATALARTLCEEIGRPWNFCVGEVRLAADVFDYYAGLALDLKGESSPRYDDGSIGLTVREPVGVVGIITPWNFPLLLVSWKIAPAIAAGCTMVVKPSEFAPSSTFQLAEAIGAAGAPAGTINVVTGEGDVVGERLVESPQVNKIAFTGSTAVGKRIMAQAAPTLKRISLELGGKSPNVVFPDADLTEAANGAFMGIYLNSGQVCHAGSRLLVHESIKDAFMERLIAATRNIQLGDPMAAGTTMGPLINEQQFERVQRYIQAGEREGATLIVGGSGYEAVAGYERGLFAKPTIFDAVSPDMAIAQEEIFGPVLSVLTFRDEAEALALANNTTYGLTAAVWTKHLDTAFRMAKGIQAGTIWVNTYHSSGLEPTLPYGGYKQSGLGREMGQPGLAEYLETKSIHLKLG